MGQEQAGGKTCPCASPKQVIDRLIAQLEGAAAALPAGHALAPIAFEKDDDTNYHMQAGA